MAWTKINQTYATTQTKVGWGHLANVSAWRRVKPDTPDGVTNVLLLLALARATDKSAFVNVDGSNLIHSVYY